MRFSGRYPFVFYSAVLICYFQMRTGQLFLRGNALLADNSGRLTVRVIYAVIHEVGTAELDQFIVFCHTLCDFRKTNSVVDHITGCGLNLLQG